MKLTARVIPWSSVVGTGVLLLDEDDMLRCVGQLALHNVTVSESEDRKIVMLGMARTVADAINTPKNGPTGINNED